MAARWDDDYRRVKLLDWLVTPAGHREPSTKTALAELLGVNPRTLRQWQEEPAFRDAWRARVSKMVGSPERAQNIMNSLYEAAIDVSNRNQVQAAKLYLEATNSIKPPPVELTVKKTSELTDEELDALLVQGAKELREAQQTDG